jgi:hypothetical protein
MWQSNFLEIDAMKLLQALIEQRADPHIYRTRTAITTSPPRCRSTTASSCAARSIAGLADAKTVDVWHKPDTGPYSELIWAPELHFNQGAWYVYFAAAPSREIKDKLFQHRMYAIRNTNANPLEGEWEFMGQVDTGIDTFCLDATTFTHKGQLYYLWAQKDVAIEGNSNLYIAPMKTPWQIGGKPVMLSKPEFDWEIRGFWVNEGPSVLRATARSSSAIRPAPPTKTTRWACCGRRECRPAGPGVLDQAAAAGAADLLRSRRLRSRPQQLYRCRRWRHRHAGLPCAHLHRDRRRPAVESGPPHLCQSAEAGTSRACLYLENRRSRKSFNASASNSGGRAG